MASLECLDKSIAAISVRTTEQNKDDALVTKWQTDIKEVVPPSRISQRYLSRPFAATDSGRSRWDDHVSRIAYISLEVALHIAARSLELSVDESFHITDGSGGEEERDHKSRGNYFEMNEDDAASIDSEVRHLPGLQNGLFEELVEVDRLATLSRHQQDDDTDLPVFQDLHNTWEKRSGDGDDLDSCNLRHNSQRRFGDGGVRS